MLLELVELLAVIVLRWGMVMEVGGPRRGESPGVCACPWWCPSGESAESPDCAAPVGENTLLCSERDSGRPVGWSYGGGVCTPELDCA